MTYRDEPLEMLRTVHGSHLYNLANEDSDVDEFVVYANDVHRRRAKYAIQKLDGKSDILLTDVSTLFMRAGRGVPQYLEALWSRKATVDVLGLMRFAFRPDSYETESTYIRTARNFWEKGDAYHGEAVERYRDLDAREALELEAKSRKLKRHAYRLCLNLRDMREFGHFDPAMGLRQQRTLNHMLHADETIDKYLGVTP